jgi:transmembrane sensor
MQKFELQYLLEKYRKNTCTPEELILLDNWYLQWETNPDDFDGEELTEVKEEVWIVLKKQIRGKKTIKLWFHAAKIAAALGFVMISIYFLTNHYYPAEKHQKFTALNKIVSGKNNAILTLGNGKKIILSNAQTSVVIDSRKLTYSDGTEIDQGLEKITNRSANEMQTISTPRGGTYQIILPDGSKVWLNAASTLKYPSSFSHSVRKVELFGEAYFEISKNKDKPFIVKSANQDVTVLGTRFNVENYSDEATVKTTLVEGAVKITRNAPEQTKESLYLKPGQQSQLTDRTIAVRTADINSVIAWTKGDFVFAEEGLTSIMRKLARWYDIDIEYRNAPLQLRFDAIISRSNNLPDLLDIIQHTGKVKFTIVGRKIIVTK